MSSVVLPRRRNPPVLASRVVRKSASSNASTTASATSFWMTAMTSFFIRSAPHQSGDNHDQPCIGRAPLLPAPPRHASLLAGVAVVARRMTHTTVHRPVLAYPTTAIATAGPRDSPAE